MEIAAVTTPDNWFWCPGPLNPSDLLTRTGSTCDQIKSDFWLHGSFLPQSESSWPVKKCVSLPSNALPLRTINLSLPENTQSLSKVISALTFIYKSCRTWRQNPIPALTWSSLKISFSSFIIKCFSSDAETLVATNRLKHLVIQPLDGVYHVPDHSFRSRIGVPSICKKTILAKCIVQDTQVELGHGRDALQLLSYIQSKFFIPGIRKMIMDL